MRSFPLAVTLPASSLLSPDSHWTQLEQTQSSGELLRLRLCSSDVGQVEGVGFTQYTQVH